MTHEDIADEDVQTIWGLSWLAVRSEDGEAVAKTLELEEPRECSTQAGFGEVATHARTFVAPPVDGWVVVIAREIAFDEQLLAKLSRAFGEAQAFFADSKRDCYMWRRSRDGEMVRDVAVTPDEVVSKGDGAPPEPSRIEKWPDVDDYDVLRVARAWSVDPNAVLRTSSLGKVGTRASAPPPAGPSYEPKRRKPNWTALAIMLGVVVLLVVLRLLLERR